MRPLFTLLPLFLTFSSTGAACSDTPVSAADVRKAIERSLPFVEKRGVAWMTERKCISCHHVSFMIWVHNDARAKGFAVDAKKIDAWTDWSAEQSLKARVWFKLTPKTIDALTKASSPAELLEKLKPVIDAPFFTEEEFLAALANVLTPEELAAQKAALLKESKVGKGGSNDGGGIPVVGQMLHGCASGSPKMTEYLAAMPKVMERQQESDGTWAAAGQFPSEARPVPESNMISTGWLALGFANKYGDDSRKLMERALAKLKTAPAGKSTESLVVALLVEHKFGTKEHAKTLRDELLQQQNADGGWGWLIGAQSDAFATGQALYALAYDTKLDDAAMQRALRFLIDTQDAGGGWRIPGTAIAAPGTKPDRLKRLEEIIYPYWGTTWAVLGMLRTLPER